MNMFSVFYSASLFKSVMQVWNMLGADIRYPRTVFFGASRPTSVEEMPFAFCFELNTLALGDEGYDHQAFLSSMQPISWRCICH